MFERGALHAYAAKSASIALNDLAFLNQIEMGRNIKIRTFDSFMLWLDAHWPRETADPAEHQYEELLNFAPESD